MTILRIDTDVCSVGMLEAPLKLSPTENKTAIVENKKITSGHGCGKVFNLSGVVTFQQKVAEKNGFHSFKEREVVIRDHENDVICTKGRRFPPLYPLSAVLMNFDVR